MSDEKKEVVEAMTDQSTKDPSYEIHDAAVGVSTQEEEAEVVLKFSPSLIDPKKKELEELALSVKEIDADPKNMNKESMELINTTKNILVKARTSIQKDGKAARKPATDFAKKVKAYEDELIGIIAPAEERMKDLEKAAKDFALKEERKKTLPEFKEKLATIGDEGVGVHDEMLLDLDPTGRDAYYNERLSTHLEAKQAKIDEAEEEKERLANIESGKVAKEKAEADLKLKQAQDKVEFDKNVLRMEKDNLRAQRLIALGFKDMGSSFEHDVEIFQKSAVMALNDEEFNLFIVETSEKVNQWSIKKKKEADDKAAQDIKDAEAKVRKEADDKAAEKEADRIAAEKKIKDDKEASDKIVADEKTKAEADEKFAKWKSEIESKNTDATLDFRFVDGVTEVWELRTEYHHDK